MDKEDIIIQEHFRKGSITPAGITNDKGELMPRAKQEPRMGLKAEDEFTIDRWNKALKRDFPDLDDSFIDLITTYCYMHPDESREYALKHANEDASKREYRSFKEMEGLYERVNV